MIEENLNKLNEYVKNSTEDIEEFIHCLNSNLPAVFERIEELREIDGIAHLGYMKNNLNNDLIGIIDPMKELFEKTKHCYLKIAENYEREMKIIEDMLKLLEGDLAEIEISASIQETSARIQSKFSQIDRNINAIQDSLLNMNDLLIQGTNN